MTQAEIKESVPIFKVNYEKKVIYFNSRAIPYLLYWKCLDGNKLPSQIVKQHPEIFDRNLVTDYYDVDLNYQHKQVHFTVIPFPEAGYIGFYGDYTNQRLD